jgi:hypothetical protein
MKNCDHNVLSPNHAIHIMRAFLGNKVKMFSKHRIEIVFTVLYNPSISFVGYKFRIVLKD